LRVVIKSLYCKLPVFDTRESGNSMRTEINGYLGLGRDVRIEFHEQVNCGVVAS